MIKCPNCNKELEDGSSFCDACGARISETVFCPNCGERCNTESNFCPRCGTQLTGEKKEAVQEGDNSAAGAGTQVETVAEPKPEPEIKVKRKFLSKKAVVFGGIAVAVVILAAVCALAVSSGWGFDKNNRALYMKEGEIYYTDFTEKGTKQITEDFMDRDLLSMVEDMDEAGYGLGLFIKFSENGKRIFYPDRFDPDADGFTLYYRDLDKPKKEPEIIDSDIILYAISRAGDKVLYIKDGDLYLHNLKEKERIASDVKYFNVTDDFQKIGYLTDDSEYYILPAGKDRVKIASDINTMEYVSEALDTFYYTRDGSLYRQTAGSDDKQRIASDIYRVVKIYDSGEIYYIRKEEEKINLTDYVNDSKADSDAAMTAPDYPEYPEPPDYPYWWFYDTYEEYEAALDNYYTEYEKYEAACERITKEYEAAKAAYSEKIKRDYLREDLKENSMTKTKYILCYFDGGKETVITDALDNVWNIDYAADAPVLVASIYSRSEAEKMDITEISSVFDVEQKIEDAFYSSSQWYIVTGALISDFDYTDLEQIRVSGDGSVIYYLDDVNPDGYGDLYRIQISNGKIAENEKFDSDVSNASLFFMEDNKLAYFKNVDDEQSKGDLYVDKVQVDYDVRLGEVDYHDGKVIYYVDWNSSKDYGSLKIFNNGEKTKIADDVHDFMTTGEGDILYICDYSIRRSCGTLYLYRKGKNIKIDDDVSALIPILDLKMAGW